SVDRSRKATPWSSPPRCRAAASSSATASRKTTWSSTAAVSHKLALPRRTCTSSSSADDGCSSREHPKDGREFEGLLQDAARRVRGVSQRTCRVLPVAVKRPQRQRADAVLHGPGQQLPG